MMYDPKTGKGYKANTYADHVKMDKMGYTHEKPEVKEEKNCGCGQTPCKTYGTVKEDYRKLAKHGMGAETKNSIRVGHGVDYYRADGAKYSGKIVKMGLSLTLSEMTRTVRTTSTCILTERRQRNISSKICPKQC